MTSCPLSEREKEILQLVAEGFSNKEIAERLYISPNTVKVHLRNIFEKLEVQSRTEAAMLAVRRGWIEPAGMEAPAAPVTPQPAVSPVSAWRKVVLLMGMALVALLVALPELRPPLSGASGAGKPALRDLPPERAPSVSGIVSGSARWRVRTSMPVPRSRLAIAVWDGLIYVIGGEASGVVSGEVDVYDPEANEWQRRTPKPVPVSNVGAAAVEGRIYIPGGFTSDGEVTDLLEIYDVQSDSWSRGAPLPTPLCGYAIASYGGKIYVFGGWDGKDYTARAFVYDPQADAWDELTPMPTVRGFAGATALDGRIYVVGGYDGSAELRTVEEYDPEAEGNLSANPWRERAPLRMGRAGVGVVAVSPWVYAIGGGWQTYLAFNEYYDPQADLWTPFESPVLGEWRNAGVAAVGNSIYVIGGWSGRPLGLVEEYQARFVIMLPMVR